MVVVASQPIQDHIVVVEIAEVEIVGLQIVMELFEVVVHWIGNFVLE